jgi:uncharacterized membrane protein
MKRAAAARSVVGMAFNVVFNTVLPALGLALLLGAALLPAVSLAALAALVITATFALRSA